jgi:short-chain fatty acids transporter
LIPRALEDTPVVTGLLVVLIGWWAWRYYLPSTGPSGIVALTPDTVNLTMLMLGLIMHGTPGRYVRAVDEAVRGCGGIILQFPLYAGILGLMRESGLMADMARGIATMSNETTLPLMTFVSAGVVNLFVPSGGGQWAVQGPIAMQAAAEVGVTPSKMVMAVAYGDQLTNMLQPFWALPLLAITGVRARDIVGYTALLMVAAGVWIGVWLVVF